MQEWSTCSFGPALAALIWCLSQNAEAQTNEMRGMFSVRRDLDQLFSSPSEPQPTNDLGAPIVQTSDAPPKNDLSLPFSRSLSVGPPRRGVVTSTMSSTNVAVGRKFEATFYYVAPDGFVRQRAGGALIRRTKSHPGLGELAKSIPFNVLKTFDLYDPVPLENGPAPSSLPLESRARPRSQTEPPEPPILFFGGKSP